MSLAEMLGIGQRAQSIEEIRAESYAAVVARLTTERERTAPRTDRTETVSCGR